MRTIVWNEHTLGTIMPNGLQILQSLVSRGSPFPIDPYLIPIPLDHVRPATEQDFTDFRVKFHPDYLKGTA